MVSSVDFGAKGNFTLAFVELLENPFSVRAFGKRGIIGGFIALPPYISGTELLQKMRKAHNQTPVILITADRKSVV